MGCTGLTSWLTSAEEFKRTSAEPTVRPVEAFPVLVGWHFEVTLFKVVCNAKVGFLQPARTEVTNPLKCLDRQGATICVAPFVAVVDGHVVGYGEPRLGNEGSTVDLLGHHVDAAPHPGFTTAESLKDG